MDGTSWFYDWPPPHLPLAARVFPERAEQADTAFDRWTLGMLSTIRVPAALRGRGRGALVRAVLKQAQGLTDWDDA